MCIRDSIEDALDTSADHKHAAARKLGEVAADVERHFTAAVHASNASGGKDLHPYEGDERYRGAHSCAAIALVCNDGADVPPGNLQRVLHFRVAAVLLERALSTALPSLASLMITSAEMKKKILNDQMRQGPTSSLAPT